MNYQLLIFDWDGTLMDSAQKIANCITAAAIDADLEPPTESAAKDIIGLGLFEAMRILFPEQNEPVFQTLVERYRHHWLVADQTPQALFPNVLDGLSQLDAHGCLLSVATGKSRVGLARAFSELEIESLFVTTRCADETRSKPHPQMLHEILEFTAIEPHQAVMIGDTTYDMEMARHAGVDAVGVSYGVHSEDRLKKAGAVDVLNSFAALQTWLNDGRVSPAFSS